MIVDVYANEYTKKSIRKGIDRNISNYNYIYVY